MSPAADERIPTRSWCEVELYNCHLSQLDIMILVIIIVRVLVQMMPH